MARMLIKTIKTPGWRQLSSAKNSGEFDADFERNHLIELEFFFELWTYNYLLWEVSCGINLIGRN